ncbi:MAG: hypothetical protein WCL14_13655, partial [Bacteroidota bacterium]
GVLTLVSTLVTKVIVLVTKVKEIVTKVKETLASVSMLFSLKTKIGGSVERNVDRGDKTLKADFIVESIDCFS